MIISDISLEKDYWLEPPLKSTISEGVAFSLFIAAQNLREYLCFCVLMRDTHRNTSLQLCLNCDMILAIKC